MKQSINVLVLFLMVLSTSLVPVTSGAETSTAEKAKQKMTEVGNDVKEAGRKAKNKACKLVNGKMECAKDKAVDKMKNIKDDVEAAGEKAVDAVD